mmetsp:Transcript_6037/g.15451  ORF Transcript_6037/g.15451 Transcript_6037/m.15451 type:complete len:283 (-) Transcript_6037:18-866(-)
MLLARPEHTRFTRGLHLHWLSNSSHARRENSRRCCSFVDKFQASCPSATILNRIAPHNDSTARSVGSTTPTNMDWDTSFRALNRIQRVALTTAESVSACCCRMDSLYESNMSPCVSVAHTTIVTKAAEQASSIAAIGPSTARRKGMLQGAPELMCVAARRTVSLTLPKLLVRPGSSLSPAGLRGLLLVGEGASCEMSTADGVPCSWSIRHHTPSMMLFMLSCRLKPPRDIIESARLMESARPGPGRFGASEGGSTCTAMLPPSPGVMPLAGQPGADQGRPKA